MRERVLAALPPGYGQVSCNVDRLPPDTGERVGLVIPSYRRYRLLRQCIASLTRSRMPDAIVCIVDESAATGLPDLEGYRLTRGWDSPGHDLGMVRGPIQDIKARCDADPRCVGFTSLGLLKGHIRPLHRRVRRRFTEFGLYVKDPRRAAIPARPGPERPLLAAVRRARVRRALRAVRDWTVPTITILKRAHGNMFDSLRTGWDLLSGELGCRYLACLDADTVVTADWLEALLRCHRDTRAWAPNPFTVVTGFHASGHPALVERETYRVKQSIGGANMLFHAALYPALRPALRHINWDDEIVRRIRTLGGTLVCTRPSVVQHRGRFGLWSGSTCFDHADDFDEASVTDARPAGADERR